MVMGEEGGWFVEDDDGVNKTISDGGINVD